MPAPGDSKSDPFLIITIPSRANGSQSNLWPMRSSPFKLPIGRPAEQELEIQSQLQVQESSSPLGSPASRQERFASPLEQESSSVLRPAEQPMSLTPIEEAPGETAEEIPWLRSPSPITLVPRP